jgi:integrase
MVDAPSKAKHDVQPLTEDEVGQFLASVREDPHEALYTVALATGLRQGEVLALRWSDVDLEAGALTVSHTLRRDGLGLGEPKTEASKRTVLLPPTALAILRRHKADQKVVRLGEGYVFATGKGTPLDHRNAARYFQQALERAGISKRRFHDMRHTFATLLLGKGVDVAVVSKALGHANLATTADIYSHWCRPMQERTAAVMESVLRPTAT